MVTAPSPLSRRVKLTPRQENQQMPAQNASPVCRPPSICQDSKIDAFWSPGYLSISACAALK